MSVTKEAMSAIQVPGQPAQDVLQIETNSIEMQTVSGSTKLGDRMDTEISYAEVVKRQGVPFNKKSYNHINKSFEQDDRDGGLNKHSFRGNNRVFRILNWNQRTKITHFYYRRKKDRIKREKMIFC